MYKYALVLALFLILGITAIFLWLPVNDADCDATDFLASNSGKYQLQATKVVVKPWLGEHHIYGIFMVPDEYRVTPFFVLNVKGAITNCEKPFGDLETIDGVIAKPGTHLIRDFIRTRVALRAIIRGKYNQINDQSNWSLIFPLINHNSKY